MEKFLDGCLADFGIPCSMRGLGSKRVEKMGVQPLWCGEWVHQLPIGEELFHAEAESVAEVFLACRLRCSG